MTILGKVFYHLHLSQKERREGLDPLKNLLGLYRKKVRLFHSDLVQIFFRRSISREEALEKIIREICPRTDEINTLFYKIEEEIDKNDFISNKTKKKLKNLLRKSGNIGFMEIMSAENCKPFFDSMSKIDDNVEEMFFILNQKKNMWLILTRLAVVISSIYKIS